MKEPRNDVGCYEFDDACAELVAGRVAEPNRSVLLEHSRACVTCARTMADLLAVTDALLELAPRTEPSLGFEDRAVARIIPVAPPDDPGSVWRRSSRLRRVVAAAAVLAIAVGAFQSGRIGSISDDLVVASNPIVSASGRTIGMADLERQHGQTRVVLTMSSERPWPGVWHCEVRDARGTWVEIGEWTAEEVTGGVWAAGVPDHADIEDATAMRILSDSGRVIAHTTFSP